MSTSDRWASYNTHHKNNDGTTDHYTATKTGIVAYLPDGDHTVESRLAVHAFENQAETVEIRGTINLGGEAQEFTWPLHSAREIVKRLSEQVEHWNNHYS